MAAGFRRPLEEYRRLPGGVPPFPPRMLPAGDAGRRMAAVPFGPLRRQDRNRVRRTQRGIPGAPGPARRGGGRRRHGIRRRPRIQGPLRKTGSGLLPPADRRRRRRRSRSPARRAVALGGAGRETSGRGPDHIPDSPGTAHRRTRSGGGRLPDRAQAALGVRGTASLRPPAAPEAPRTRPSSRIAQAARRNPPVESQRNFRGRPGGRPRTARTPADG